MDWRHYAGPQGRFSKLFVTLFSIQLSHSLVSQSSQHILHSCLSRLLDDAPITGNAPHVNLHDAQVHIVGRERRAGRQKRQEREDNGPEINRLELLFQDPLINATSIDRYINSDHTYNLSSAEMEFFRLPTDHFHRKVFKRLYKWQLKTLNESMIKVQAKLENYALKHGLKCDGEYRVPGKDGLKIFFGGLRHYRDEMLCWVKHTFVDKPKTLVREQKIALELFMDNATEAIPRSRVRSFWRFERCFANMMRYYEQEMTDRILDHYDKMILHYMTGGESGGTFQFPRSLPDLVDHLNAHAHIFTLNVRNETTTEHCSVNEKQFTLDSEQKKAAREQLRDWSEWSTEFA